jgi:acyl-CoA thioester hydrolase
VKSPFVFESIVKPEWIDHNGHMNVGYFVVAFDEATDAVYEEWGIGMEYPRVSGCSVFTLGMNVDYLAELFEGDPIRIETLLVDHDHKRIHYFHRMFNSETSQIAATNECMCMNVDLGTRKSAPFHKSVLDLLEEARYQGAEPQGLGRKLGIRRS